jgi:translation initiation factor 1A
MGDYGDFEEIKEAAKEKPKEQIQQQEPQFQTRARLPRQNQLIGIVLERLGGKRMSIKTTDKKIRNCRVPGKFKRKFWLRPGNLVLIEPWPDDDEKGDVVYQYQQSEVTQLKKRGLINNLDNEF